MSVDRNELKDKLLRNWFENFKIIKKLGKVNSLKDCGFIEKVNLTLSFLASADSGLINFRVKSMNRHK
jgi:hypothetical protein